MKIGFTGTQHGMIPIQQNAVGSLLMRYLTQPEPIENIIERVRDRAMLDDVVAERFGELP